jgi:hypothetical protein
VAPVQETFTEALEFTSEFTSHAWPNLIKHFDPVWVDEALVATDTATIRRRRLPAEQTVWLVLGMAVMRDLPIAAVARQLDIALPAADGSCGCQSPTSPEWRTTRGGVRCKASRGARRAGRVRVGAAERDRIAPAVDRAT